MAATFALLVLLPAFGQTTFDRTDGRISSGGLSVGVFDDIADAQLEKNVEDRSGKYPDEIVYLPVENPGIYLGTRGSVNVLDTAYLANGLASPQHTFFGGTLWVFQRPGETTNTTRVAFAQLREARTTPSSSQRRAIA